MDYRFFPPVKQLDLSHGSSCSLDTLGAPRCSAGIGMRFFQGLPERFKPEPDPQVGGFRYLVGNVPEDTVKTGEQGYVLRVREDGILLQAEDEAGFRYGLDTLRQALAQAGDRKLHCMEIHDSPTLKKRGLMLDISRGRVYTLDYLLELVDLLSVLRFNVFQLYVEHTFEFLSHPEISQGSDPLTAGDITALQARCREKGIELQANLQSLGHMNRILTRPEHMELAESEMYWSIDTTSEKSYELLDDLYREYLPLFDSPWLNICSDEPYDLGKGKSASIGKELGGLYLDHLLRIHDLAAKYGKRIMLFGDVVKEHPDKAGQMPSDIVYIDWIYDPKAVYGTPARFRQTGIPYWVSPGTGNWNTLFPRLDGSITNIVNLTLEGIREQAEGMLLTDWNDHGGYTQQSASYYSYAYAASVSWCGVDPGEEAVSRWADQALDLPGYGAVVRQLAEIYQIPPIWSKNRSECVMALFDEPIFGNALRGPKPPKTLKAYDLTLPEGVQPVLERHSQHPMRPYFRIPDDAVQAIRKILENVDGDIRKLHPGRIRNQIQYIADAFHLMLDKLELSRRIIARMEGRELTVPGFIGLEDELRIMIQRYVRLQMDFTTRWLEVARPSEISISLTYFAHIISRLDYLRDWLSLQREQFHTVGVDWEFSTYETAGYRTLQTY